MKTLERWKRVRDFVRPEDARWINLAVREALCELTLEVFERVVANKDDGVEVLQYIAEVRDDAIEEDRKHE